jgi:predicted transposase/invertase (TIGR01784 family)
LECKIAGKKEVKKEIARNCLKKGMSITDILELTGLSEDEITDMID